jgi:hypothetical protein
MTAEGSSFRRRVFVVMPFGKKDVPRKPRADLPPGAGSRTNASGDFDTVYNKLFRPALEATGLQPFRADDRKQPEHQDMFAELVTADSDISILNAGFYELEFVTWWPTRRDLSSCGMADRPFDQPQRTFKCDGKLFRVGHAGRGVGETVADEVCA